MGNCAHCLKACDNVVVEQVDGRVLRAFNQCPSGCVEAGKQTTAGEPMTSATSIKTCNASEELGGYSSSLVAPPFASSRPLLGTGDALRESKVMAIYEALDVTDGDASAAARLLGCSRETIRRVLRREGVRLK